MTAQQDMDTAWAWLQQAHYDHNAVAVRVKELDTQLREATLVRNKLYRDLEGARERHATAVLMVLTFGPEADTCGRDPYFKDENEPFL